MWNLIRFFVRNGPFFTWLLLTILSIILLCQQNPYHRSAWLTSANVVTGSFYKTSDNVSGYFGLRTINKELLSRTGLLEEENIRLKRILRDYECLYDQSVDTTSHYKYTVAHVVSNSINQKENYITLDKGRADGVRQDQGVADQNGVVGIVSKVSEHFSLVISVLNPNLRLSVSLKNDESYGSLWWDGESPEYALVEDLPRTVRFLKGDTIVTTDYSTSFPQGVPVGTVAESYDQADNNNFVTLRVKLFSDFNRINDVHIIQNEDKEERDLLEAEK